jgi:hypothetical protein
VGRFCDGAAFEKTRMLGEWKTGGLTKQGYFSNMNMAYVIAKSQVI